MCGNYLSKEASVLFKLCNGMHMNRPQAKVSLTAAYSLKTRIVLLFTHCTFNETDAAPCEWMCGISDNHGPRIRQCLRNCHRNENARTAPEPHIHAFEAGRLHSSQNSEVSEEVATDSADPAAEVVSFLEGPAFSGPTFSTPPNEAFWTLTILV